MLSCRFAGKRGSRCVVKRTRPETLRVPMFDRIKNYYRSRRQRFREDRCAPVVFKLMDIAEFQRPRRCRTDPFGAADARRRARPAAARRGLLAVLHTRRAVGVVVHMRDMPVCRRILKREICV